MIKEKLYCCFVFLISVCGLEVYSCGVVPADNKAYKYAITFLEGRDAIPQSCLEERLMPFNVDIYPVLQGKYTKLLGGNSKYNSSHIAPEYLLAKSLVEREGYGEAAKWAQEILQTKEKAPAKATIEIKKEIQEYLSPPGIWQLGKNDLEG
jgi:hypothetical protein